MKSWLQSRAEYTKKVNGLLSLVFVKNVDCFKPTLCKILDLLQDDLEKGLSSSTLKVQVTALSAHLNCSLSKYSLIRRSLKGSLRGRTTVLKPISKWNLSIVLKGLWGCPLELLEIGNQKFLSFKITFLLLITSAKKVGELQVLSLTEVYIKMLPNRGIKTFLSSCIIYLPFPSLKYWTSNIPYLLSLMLLGSPPLLLWRKHVSHTGQQIMYRSE